MMTFPSDEADKDFMTWFTKSTQRDFQDAIDECDYFSATQILENAFISGYNKGCSDYSMSMKICEDLPKS